MAEELLSVGDADFDAEVLNSELPVLVDFWATWCEPCKRIEPVIKELAAQYAGKLKVVKLNVEEQRQISAKYKIRSMPTFMVFRNGGVKETQLGAVPKSQLVQFIDRALA
jgi:thioredoxin 1